MKFFNWFNSLGIPVVGHKIKWIDIIGHVFRVIDFDRDGTKIDQNGKVVSTTQVKPYGYLLVESPIMKKTIRLPIIHHDDFRLAASVFDDSNFNRTTKKI